MQGKYADWMTPEGLAQVEGWARAGLTDKQIAHNMGIAVKTLYRWERQFPALRAALKKGKAIADVEVENALYKRAVGYKYTETTRERRIDPATGRYAMQPVKEVEREALPDTTAIIYWLKNRRPDLWRDRRVVDLGEGQETGVILLPRRLSDDGDK